MIASATARIGARMIEFAHKANDEVDRDRYYHSFALGIARGMAESIVITALGDSTVRPEYVEAALQWALDTPDSGQSYLTPTQVRSLKRAISNAVHSTAHTPLGV